MHDNSGHMTQKVYGAFLAVVESWSGGGQGSNDAERIVVTGYEMRSRWLH